MPFETLSPEIRSVLASLGFQEPTPSQELAIPHLLKDENILLMAPTGIGKTEAAIIPIFQRFLQLQKEGVFAGEEGFSIIYVTPLRALNRDMLRRLKEWGQKLGIRIAVRHGDTSQHERNKQSRNPPDMLITTPESFQLMFTGKNLRHALGSVRWVVLDEIHEIAASERGAQLSIALERLEELIQQQLLNQYTCKTLDKERLKKDIRRKDAKFIRIGLSATVGSPKKIASFISGNVSSRKIRILDVAYEKKITLSVETPEVTKEARKLAPKLEVSEELSAFTIASVILHTRKLIDQHQSTLFFVNTRNMAELLASRFSLADPDYPISIHHGSLYKDIRMEMEDKFKSGDIKSLICTSSLELGIDVGKTDLVIQFNSARRMERLIQRVGRGGHGMGRSSKGVVIVTDFDNILEAAVIGKNTLKRKVERTEIRMNPLDVLANQLAAMANSEKRLDIDKTFELVKRAYPFKFLSLEKFQSTLEFLGSTRILFLDRPRNEFAKSKDTIPYFYSNISMIPDERKFALRNITDGREIGFLDEVYVMKIQSSLDKGETPVFVVKGRSWTAVSVEEEKDEVTVVPNFDISKPPRWLGMDIPVSFEVAQEAGRLRRLIKEGISGNTGHQHALLSKEELQSTVHREISRRYPISMSSFAIPFEFIHYHLKNDLDVPDDRQVTLEQSTKHIIVNCCFGTKVNETLAQLITYFLVKEKEVSAAVLSDSYRIIIDRPGGISAKDVASFLLGMNPSSLRSLLKKVVYRSDLLEYQLFFTGKKFGAIRKNASWRKLRMSKITEAFQGTLLLDECFEKVLWERMNLAKTKKVLELFQNGEIEMKVTPITPIGKLGVESRKSLTSPEKAKEQILEALKSRLENTVRRFVCLNCGLSSKKKVKNVEEKVSCTACGSVMVAALSQYDKEKPRIIKKEIKGKNLAAEELKEYKKIKKNANLVSEYGHRAALCLAGRGVGEGKAAIILAKLWKDEKKLLEEILKAEIHFAKYKRFWD